MPLGPRPEPPPVPKKEPRTHHPEYYHNTLASQSVKARPARVPVPAFSSFGSADGNSSGPELASIVRSESSSRLKGPRPLGPPPKPPKVHIPYPTESVGMPKVDSQHHLSILDDPEDLRGPGGPGAPMDAMGVISMPEPELDNDFVIPSPSIHFPSVPETSPASTHLSRFSTTNTSLISVPSLVPPPFASKNQYAPATKSIFQWGIPAELLPPTPVPVNSMSGLQVGSEGQYTMNIDLPQIPPMEPLRTRFSVEELTVADFQTPQEIWSISTLAHWLYELVMAHDAEITVEDGQQALTRLFLYRMTFLDWSKAEKIACSVIASLKSQKFITSGLEQLVLRTSGSSVSGVVTEFSGYTGCYSQSIHSVPPDTRCYSWSCPWELHSKQHPHSRVGSIYSHSSSQPATHHTVGTHLRVASTQRSNSTFSRISGTTTNLDEAETRVTGTTLTPVSEENLTAVSQLDPFVTLEMNWRKYWLLEESDVKDVDPTVVKLQFAIHELIMSELLYVRDLQIYVDVYGEIELLEGLSVMSNQAEFSTRVFDRIRRVLAVNQQLLARLLERQQQQGPYVQEIADLIREWALEPETLNAYEQYANDYLWSDNHLRRELLQSTRLQKWMEERAKDPRLTGRPHSFFFNRILPRVARYHLLLGAILKYTEKTGPEAECHIIEQAIQGANNLTRRCDECVAKQKRVLDVQNLKAHIVFKSSSVTADLKLGDKRRRLIRRGDMLRRGDLRMDWVETHTLLLDNFLVLSKTREGMKGTAFYVTKSPIPLDLLVLESFEEEGVVKVSSRITLTRHGPVEEAEQKPENERPPIMYPLRITHLGSGGQKYVLFVPTRPERAHWAQSIIEAKQSRAQLAFSRSAEPFRMEKIADEFAYPESETPQLSVPIPDTPLHRAVGEINADSISRISLRRKVNCLTMAGLIYLAGTDHGLWIGIPAINSVPDNTDPYALPRRTEPIPTNITWKCVISNPMKIIKLEVLDTMNAVFVLCSDHNLSWYPLDQIVSRGLGDSRRVIGTRLNQMRKVVDFTVAYHRGRVVVLYLQQGGALKAVEPIRSHGALAMRNLAKYGLTPGGTCIDSFREVDRMQVGTDTTRITAFVKSIILTGAKSFEWATLESKQPIRFPTGANSKEAQHWGRPIRIIKLDNSRMLLCYEACYVMCDTSGNLGIHATTWFLEKCIDCAYYAPYLILFAQGGELIEIRYVDEFPGRLVQIVTGKDIKLLSNGEEPVYIRIAHPWVSGRQLMLQLVGNEVVKDTENTWQSSSV